MSYLLKKTKVIATSGPAISSGQISLAMLTDDAQNPLIQQALANFQALFTHGVNVVRFNFSHGSHEEQLVRLKLARQAAQNLNWPVGFLLDTKGPEIRVNSLADPQGLPVQTGEIIYLHCLEERLGIKGHISVSDSTKTYNMAKDVTVGGLVLVDDGKLTLRVTEVDVTAGVITTVSENQHLIKANKRINLVGATYTIPFLSVKDVADIHFAITHQFDYLALSFVNHPDNIAAVKKVLGVHQIPLIAKIETMDGMNNLAAITAVCEGVMIARGDLALETQYECVPYYANLIIKECARQKKLVIMATQMLDSLERNLIPTRAEVTDCYVAVQHQVDVSMLSGETASGWNPINAAMVMSKINLMAEKLLNYAKIEGVFSSVNPGVGALLETILAHQTRLEKMQQTLNFVLLFSNEPDFIAQLSRLKLNLLFVILTSNQVCQKHFYLHYGVSVHYVSDLSKAVRHYQTAADVIATLYGVFGLVAISPDNQTLYVHNTVRQDLLTTLVQVRNY